jgi:hypothetical protein
MDQDQLQFIVRQVRGMLFVDGGSFCIIRILHIVLRPFHHV